MLNNCPIGIFDSGVGGLSVAKSIRRRLPNEPLLYIADSLHAPYGNKSTEFVERRSQAIVQHLLDYQAKAIVVACNTATTAVIDKLRRKFSVPIIGVEPGIKPAINKTKTGIIGVMATKHTLASKSFSQLVGRFSGTYQIEVQACSGLVEQIEKPDLNGHQTCTLLKRYLAPLLARGADTIVLGCTHYAFLEPAIKQLVGDEIQIINTSMAIAKETHRRLESEKLLASSDLTGDEFFLTSSQKTESSDIFSQLWGTAVTVQQIKPHQGNYVKQR